MNWKKIVGIAALVLVLLIATTIALSAKSSRGVENTSSGRSFLNDSSKPRGIRNNNPGNLVRTNPPQGWLGSLPSEENTDGRFEQFESYTYGVRAMLKLLQNYIKSGDNTIRKILSRWAPPNVDNNNTEEYIANVERWTKVGQNLPFDASNKVRLRLLAKAIERHENGIEVMTNRDFDKAYKLL